VIREISVQNLALIEDIRVELEPGYCAWTGETGAGKSLLLTALALVLGGKASVDLIRTGKSEARAAAVFEIHDRCLRVELETILNGPLDDQLLLVTRRITSSGRTIATVNGLPVTVATLEKLGERLVDIHSQLEGRALLDPDRQLNLLDAYGQLGDLLGEYHKARHVHDSLRRKRQALIDSAQVRQRERALLEFEHEELAAADPRPGEFDELNREAHRLQHAGQVRAAAAGGYSLLYEAERSARDLLIRTRRMITPLASAVPELSEPAATLDRLADEAREVAFSLRDLSQGLDDDPARLDEIETRLALYRKLAARFQCVPDDLARRRAAVLDTLAGLKRDDTELLSLEAPLATAWSAVTETSSRLTAARRKIATQFSRAVGRRLKPLGLRTARLSVAVEPRELPDEPAAATPPEMGADRVEMLFSANPGEEPRALRRIVSGGELSRLMLAIESELASVDRVSTLIFDEIDAGVGGRLGSALGKVLAGLARHHQVICITHLPQIASYARYQWVIRKQVKQGRSRTTIRRLEHRERVDELAAMLRGDSAAEGTRKEALEMLREAREFK
jgi:DNA repair protein RecN (Recombination protein N)